MNQKYIDENDFNEKKCLSVYTGVSLNEIQEIYDYLKVNSFREMIDKFKYQIHENELLKGKVRALEHDKIWYHPEPVKNPDGTVTVHPSIKIGFYDIKKNI